MLDYDPDVVIAIGGGSAIDSAKSIREFATRASQKEVALIAIPTTSGTGSEVTSFAVVSDPAPFRPGGHFLERTDRIAAGVAADKEFGYHYRNS